MRTLRRGKLEPSELLEDGHEVRAFARDPNDAGDLGDAGCEVVEADVLEPEKLGSALEEIDVAYYLVHSMGRGSDDDDFAARDHEGARNFAAAAAAAGVRRIFYLGGLGEGSEHLESRNATPTPSAKAPSRSPTSVPPR